MECPVVAQAVKQASIILVIVAFFFLKIQFLFILFYFRIVTAGVASSVV